MATLAAENYSQPKGNFANSAVLGLFRDRNVNSGTLQSVKRLQTVVLCASLFLKFLKWLKRPIIIGRQRRCYRSIKIHSVMFIRRFWLLICASTRSIRILKRIGNQRRNFKVATSGCLASTSLINSPTVLSAYFAIIYTQLRAQRSEEPANKVMYLLYEHTAEKLCMIMSSLRKRLVASFKNNLERTLFWYVFDAWKYKFLECIWNLLC